MKIIVLGAGLVGGPMAADLASGKDFEITVADLNPEALRRLAGIPGVRTVERDLSDPESVRVLVAPYDLVLSAVPGHMGFQTLRALIEAGKSAVDIAFFPEDPFLLDGFARERGVTAVVDCGVAPGMSNMLIGYAQTRLDEIESVEIYVGGLPEVREWPYDYKAGFSPIDVIEEYVRPARLVQNGQVVVRPALSDPEYLSFPGLGTLEAFNTDGLRTLVRTIPAPDMKEKTLRYPGHIEKIAVLRETGFFSQEEIEVRGCRLRPIDVTAKILFPIWKLGPGDRDMTVMRVSVGGKKDRAPLRCAYDLLDRFDPETGVHSMARTTGYTATMVVRLLASGRFSRKGIIAPELIGSTPGCLDFIRAGLAARGVVYREEIG
jgi:lysine 6-dehydrogenase